MKGKRFVLEKNIRFVVLFINTNALNRSDNRDYSNRIRLLIFSFDIKVEIIKTLILSILHTNIITSVNKYLKKRSISDGL